MTSEFVNFQASLLRRFSSVGNLPSPSVDRARSSSFSIGYLTSYKDESEEEPFDVTLTKIALRVAKRDGFEAADEVIGNFANGTNTPAKLILSPDEAIDVDLAHYTDRYLASAPLMFDGFSKRKRSCYDSILRELGIRTPLDKKGMLALARRVDKAYEPPNLHSFGALALFIWDFALRTWPLFDATILHIPLKYFDFDHEITVSEMQNHLALMDGFGLERLLARLIVLQAVCKSETAKQIVTSGGVLELCEYSDFQIQQVYEHLETNGSGIDKEQLEQAKSENPIERATFLTMYMLEFRSEFDFMERLIEVNNTDKSVLGLLQWDPFLPTVRECTEIPSPQLVAMAAIFSQENVLRRSQRFKARYIPTSAATHLFKYADYFRSRSDGTAHRFFRTFQKFSKPTQITIFEYLLRPGVMDGLSNIFPSGRKLLKHVERNDAINALSLKLDCVSFLKIRDIIHHESLDAIDADARHRLRQVKYEDDISGGRIHLNSAKLRSEIRTFFGKNHYAIPQQTRSNDQREVELRNFLLRDYNQKFAERLTYHICFSSKFALDYLLSNLRHSFLRFKLETAIDKSFEPYPEAHVPAFKSSIKIPLDAYCKDWLTISKTRSFYKGLRSMILSHLSLVESAKADDYDAVSDMIVDEVIGSYQRLLVACKQVWGSGAKEEILEAVLSTLLGTNYATDSVLLDSLTKNFEYIFADTEGWLSINQNPIQASFALRELFEFEATNYSSARTHRRPITVSCYDKEEGGKPIDRVKDVYLSGELFGGVVQLIQNLLQNSFQYCSLPIKQIRVEVAIIDLGQDHIEVEFRNAFAPEVRGKMRDQVKKFNQMVSQARAAAKIDGGIAPVEVGGSGLKRIFFDLQDHLGDDFWLLAKDDEINRDTFLVQCGLPKKRASA
ncbi:hypothetical protein SAMN05421665_0510 [Yoonia rosea]|uniref:Uncharacterized protein n=1 Tax=Yoonia rosea TaxID=287098 RepID=A0A1R3WGE5_9RHOB|nr:hypothetical protein [Yoonia rosea]SIT77160.1 hypothetical protein SAMN05421665_0510 [Yoonia rosea]